MPSDAADDQSGDGVDRFFNVQLRVTNERSGISQVHDVLVKARTAESAKVQAKENVLSDGEDTFDTLEVSDLGGGGDDR